MFTKEFKNSIKIVFSIVGVGLLCSLLKNIQSSFGGSVSEVAFYVCYLFIVVLIIKSFTDIMGICEETIIKLSDFVNILIPLILALLLANGSIATVGILKPVLLFMVSCINVIVSKFILPILFISTMLGLVSNISEGIEISKLPKFLQKISMWCLELLIVVFIGTLSVEGTLAANVDGVTAKGAKTIVSTVVPVVGKALSDATDSILGAASITKNAIGVLGVIIIIGISILPIIKVLVLMLVYNVAEAIIEPIVDKRISKCMSSIGDSMKMIVGVMATTSVLFILSTTLMIKMGNFTIMYR